MQTATAVYANDACTISVNGVSQPLPVYDDRPNYIPQSPNLIAIHATRDDGHVNNFKVGAGGLVAEPGVADRIVVLADSTGVTTGYQLTDEQDRVETYDTTGKLLSIADRAGNTQSLTYAGPNGALSLVTDNVGHRLSLGYDASNRLHTVTAPDGSVTTYDYDPAGHLWKITNADGSSHQFLYQDPNWPTGISSRIDETGVANLLWQYDPQGRVLNAQLGGISTGMRFTYNADGSTTETDPLGAIRTFVAQQIGNHLLNTAVTGDPCTPCGFSKAIAYDSGGFPVSRTDYNDHQTTFIYDDIRGLETSRTEANGTAQKRTIATSWNPAYRLPTRILEPARQTDFGYDAAGNLRKLTITDRASQRHRIWNTTYNGSGQPLTLDGPRTDIADISTLTYYSCTTGAECGQLHTVTDAFGHVTTITAYDASARPTSITDANGLVTTLGYEPRGKVNRVQVGTEVTSLSYWPTGQLQQISFPSGASLRYAYNAAQQLIDVYDQLGDHIAITPDAMGNATQTRVYDPAGTLVQTHQRVYNRLNQLVQDIGSLSGETTAYGFDGNGNLQSVTDPLNHASLASYDGLDRISKLTDAASGITQYGYDSLDQLTSVTDPRTLATRTTVDALGNASNQQSPDSGSTGSSFDDAGNILTRTDAKGQTTRYQYDALNRLTQIASADGKLITYTWDQTDAAHGAGIGRLTRMTDSSGTTDWTYDGNGRVTQKSNHYLSNTFVFTTTYSYDTSGRILSMTLPQGRTVGYLWSNGQITALTLNGVPLVSSLVYQPFSGPKSWTLGNGETVSRAYDLDGRISADPVDSLIGYDSASRITTRTLGNRSAVSGSSGYGYDALDRLTSATGSSTIAYGYDASGNRSSQTLNSSATSYTIDPASNRIASVSGPLPVTPGYDANGSLTSTGSGTTATSYTYDALGRLASVTRNAITTTYTYDGLGQRTNKASSTSGRVFIHDEAGHLIGEFQAGGSALIQETIYLGDMPVAVVTGAGTFYIHTDPLNTPRQIDNSAGLAVWAWTPNPFGETPPNQDPRNTRANFIYNPRYPGQYYDAESGLYHNGFRDYDPGTGRYVESDPIGLRGGINTYGYVGGNPVSYVDPFGLSSVAFNPGAGTVTIYNGQGNTLGIFPAGNNTTSTSRGPWSPGNYSYGYHTTHPNDAPNSSFGSNGNFVFNVPGCIGCGIHSGRANKGGPSHKTEGCIRSNDEATQLLNDLNQNGDPLDGLYVGPNPPIGTLPDVFGP